VTGAGEGRVGAVPARTGGHRFRRRIRWSIGLRLTLTYGALFFVGGALLLAFTYTLVVRFDLADGSPPGIATPRAPAVPSGLAAPPPTSAELSVPPAPPAPSGAPDIGGGALPGAGSPSAAIRVPSASDITRELDERLALQRDRELRSLLAASGIALLAMTFASVGLGWLTARRALRPLRTMTIAAREISERNLHRRLALAGPQDEIKSLADTFDGLLGRLEGAFEAQRRFVANASHELRTPLTLSRSLLEVSLAAPEATAGDLRETCRRVLESNRQEERLIEALLTLARSQRGLDRRVGLDLAELAADRVESVGPAARALRCRIEADLGPAWIDGDAPLVERLVGNLLDNAIRHNTADGWASIRTGAPGGRPTLRVVNSGPVVPPDQLDALFQPFRRLARDRTATERDGPGLGLSIVAAIVTAHGADLRADPRPEGGLDISISFRRPTPESAAGRPAARLGA
jgi:signal transduction histidine kinase